MDKNGKWQVGFWVLGAITAISLPALAAAIVNNDRLRAIEDQRIEEKVAYNQTDIAVLKNDIKSMMCTQDKMDKKLDRLLNR